MTPAARKGASDRAVGAEASRRISARVRELGDWRGETLQRVRELILAADPGITEEWKWMGTPVWSKDGNLCTGETYKAVVKLTFAHGASLPDPKRLFNSSLEGNTRRAIDLREGERLDARAFKALVRAAVAFNGAKVAAARPVRLLSGGNPQIAKADGDAPVRAYIAALPGWKRGVAQRLDALIVRTLPTIQKAVKWNSPLYRIEGKGFIVGVHAFTHYLKVTFFYGRRLKPMPPVPSKDANARYVHLTETEFDEAQLVKWLKQAAKGPGWMP